MSGCVTDDPAKHHETKLSVAFNLVSLCWLQDVASFVRRRVNCKTSHWLQDVASIARRHIDCKTSCRLQDVTSIARRYVDCKTLCRLQDVASIARRVDCKTSFSEEENFQFVSIRKTLNAFETLSCDHFSAGINTMLYNNCHKIKVRFWFLIWGTQWVFNWVDIFELASKD